MSRRTYVYRLFVKYPEGVDWRNPPEAWTPYGDGLDGPEETFSWPQDRVFLSRRAADRRADRLRSYGCLVALERSEPVTWPAPVVVGGCPTDPPNPKAED